MKYGILLLTICSNAVASDYYPIVKQRKPVVRVYNRLISFEKPKVKVDVEKILAEARAMQMALDAIPVAPPINQRQLFRKFKFKNNMPTYRPPAKTPKAVIQTQRITKTYVGTIRNTFKVNADGTIDFGASTQQPSKAGY